MNEKKHISEKLQFLEDKIKKLKEESESRSWEIRGHKIVIENKMSLLVQRSNKSAVIHEEISQKEQELEKACNTRENVNKRLDVTLLKKKILSLKSRLEAVDKVIKKLSEEMESHKRKRRELTTHVDDEALYHYNRLSGSRDGNPIVQLIGNACSGCFMNVTTQTLNALNAGKEFELCPNCKRILFLSEDDQIRNG